MRNKKGQAMDQLGALGVGIVSLILIFTVIFLISAQTKTQLISTQPCENSSNYYNSSSEQCQGNSTSNSVTYGKSISINGSNALTSAAATIPDWVGLVVIAVIGGILLSLVAIFRR